jgi:spore maturation protein CgeB
MRILCVFSQYNYGDPSRGEGYEYVNFIPSLRRLGHQVQFFENWHRSCYRDFADLNKSFLRAVEEVQPEVILSVQVNYEIWSETWEMLRDFGRAATVNWATDDSWRYSQFSRFMAPFFHAFTTTYPSRYAQYRKDGIRHVLLTQWGVNDDILQPPIPAADCQYPITFIGTAHSNRRAWVDALRKRGIKVICFGYGWEHGPIPAADIPKIIQSSIISLNFSGSGMVLEGIRFRKTNQIKARTFEIPGAGGFLLSEWADGLERQYVPGREIAVFHNQEDLEGQIRHYLANPTSRDTIAQAGYTRTRAEHTYDRRLAEVLDFTLKQRDNYFARCGQMSSGKFDWNKLNQAVRSHRPTGVQLILKHSLTFLCSRIWGPVRGPHAARRLAFELSWRLAGSKTYSASGWPGRMFYEIS